MTWVSGNIILIDNAWWILIPLLLVIIGFSCFVVGLFYRFDRVNLTVTAICFLCLLLFCLGSYLFLG